MKNLFQGSENMLLIVVLACIIVILAIVFDLISGLYKAKLRGDFRSSLALKRTISKFLSYIGSMLLATGVDILVFVCGFFSLLGIEALHGIPVFTCLIGIFLLVVEFISIREKADDKTKARMSEAVVMLNNMLGKENVKDALREILKSAADECDDEKEKQTAEA